MVLRYINTSKGNVNESGQIKNPEDIRGMLTELKWPFRASAFREISIQLTALGDSEANERDHLAAKFVLMPHLMMWMDQNYSNPSRIVWNMSGVQEWLKAVETCLGNLFALMHYKSGHYGPSVRMEAGMEVIDAGAVSVDPARYAELRAIMGSQASLRSKEQAAARWEEETNAEEIRQGLMTIVVIPLQALLQDMSRGLDEKNIKYIQWTAGTSEVRHNTHCILVSADTAASPSFLTFLAKIFLAKQLARIVLDEVQAILTSEHFGSLQCSFFCSTAQLLQILPATTKLIHAPTTHPNIVYSRFKIDSQDTNRLTFTDGDGRISGWEVVYLSIASHDAELLAGRLGCGFYHTKLDEACQKLVYNQWTSGQGSCILTTTSCLGAGMDNPSVRMVVHWKSPHNLLDKEQESGRARRDGEEAHSVVFWDPSDKGWRSALGPSVLAWKSKSNGRLRTSILGLSLVPLWMAAVIPASNLELLSYVIGVELVYPSRSVLQNI
ncbi:P-loop containing nucleoside triphosphate hydrolase protein [Suillus clintonianus]|uniref:P-loop containing nucleoside triphosphate hydrolase protein n=1 Tax=Suillus clintonianus TaxID=1904413 RepID=UPI001B8796B0|nr:P-loop containing nucleoside triphosphate hydrolase protein [Suillus clintonianus]KAG2141212.1 P-loop containing nucleoside triphosphate hydrolase protein [Suillus clintonianus]